MTTLHLHTDAGASWALEPADRRVVGRAADAGLCIDDVTLARHHFALSFEAGRWWVEDLESPSGTWVNDAIVRGRVGVGAGDRIRAGRTVFRVG